MVRYTNTKKKRMWRHKKHDMKYLGCLSINDGDGKMEFQGLSNLCEVAQSQKQKEEVSFVAGRGITDTEEGKTKSTKYLQRKTA
ncbi:hypothetical protein AVEN_250937-1 [Araneus ventricosus]|uniref:Uncharacterized protein n=1 Tax=Araneus ventricosus TaxID=182803 RepID=A0A4Y2WFI8_ARAVE|nr:hypothetical protein AVEN_250937-1 [Araneus ventricosus]